MIKPLSIIKDDGTRFVQLSGTGSSLFTPGVDKELPNIEFNAVNPSTLNVSNKNGLGSIVNATQSLQPGSGVIGQIAYNASELDTDIVEFVYELTDNTTNVVSTLGSIFMVPEKLSSGGWRDLFNISGQSLGDLLHAGTDLLNLGISVYDLFEGGTKDVPKVSSINLDFPRNDQQPIERIRVKVRGRRIGIIRYDTYTTYTEWKNAGFPIENVWSNNSAFVLLDFLTSGFDPDYQGSVLDNEAWGRFRGYGAYDQIWSIMTAQQKERFLQDIYHAGSVCEEILTKGGVSQKRYTTNVAVKGPAPLIEKLQLLASVFHAKVIIEPQNIIRLIQDNRHSPISHLACPDNVVDGEFIFSEKDVTTIFTTASVKYYDPRFYGKKSTTVVDLRQDLDSYLPSNQVKQLDAWGINNEDQAIRHGKWFIYTNGLDQNIGKWIGGVDHRTLIPGEFVIVETRNGYYGRIATQSGNNLTVNQPIAVSSGVVYITLFNGTIVERNFTASGTNMTLSQSTSTQVGAVFIIKDSNNRMFEITHTKESNNGLTYEIVGYNSIIDKWNLIDSGYSISYAYDPTNVIQPRPSYTPPVKAGLPPPDKAGPGGGHYVANTINVSNQWLRKTDGTFGFGNSISELAVSFWAKVNNTQERDVLILGEQNVINFGVRVILNRSNNFTICNVFINQDGTTPLMQGFGHIENIENDWVHFLFTCKPSDKQYKLYANSEELDWFNLTINEGNSIQTQGNSRLFSNIEETQIYNGDFSELWVKNEFVDNPNKFRDQARGKPLGLSTFGTGANIYMKGTASEWTNGINFGTGGNWNIKNGVFTQGSPL